MIQIRNIMTKHNSTKVSKSCDGENHRHLMDSTDLGLTRKTRKVSAEKADLIDNFIALISISTYLADIVTDGLAAHQYYSDGHWSWFGLTLTFIVIPSFIMQLLSCKWYHEDFGEQKCWSILLHILQLGPVQRYCTAFWCGLKTLCMPKIDEKDFLVYLTNWRDVTMLRLIEAFVESAPQVVLQLYILSTFTRKIEWSKDWITILAALISIISLAWSIVSYTHASRLSAREKGLSVCGYIFQVTYRLCMVTSRVVAFVIFASEFKWIIFIVVFIHWLLMICWLYFQGTKFCYSPNKCIEKWLDYLFAVLIAFIHIFCFINTQEGTSRQRVMAYYIIFFVENSLMIAVWYPTRTGEFGLLEYGALSIVWGGFFLGILSMLIYYKLFHPAQDITSGWLCCVMCSSKDVIEINVDETSDQNGTPVSAKHHHALIKKSDNFIPVDVELSARSDKSPCQSRNKKPSENAERVDENIYQVSGKTGKLKIVDNDTLENENWVAKPNNYGSTVHYLPRHQNTDYEQVKPSHFV